MSGMDFLLAYRSMNAVPSAKVIFCTTENGIGHIQAAIDAGADEYVMKPFDRETIESKLQILGCI
jgi:two-component system chemotaxis response regulator CheY